MAARARLDHELVRRGLAPSRTAAQALIEDGKVVVEGVAVPKPASQVTRDQHISVAADGPRFASRGGLKLDRALDDLALDVSDVHAMDAGCAHGGFTDVLLRRGAASVLAVDVAYGQLAWTLRNDPRVRLLERTNVRHLTAEDVAATGAPPPTLVVTDLSFISVQKVLPALSALAAAEATLLPMVKPQFELGPEHVGKGGVVRAPASWRRALDDVVEVATALGWTLVAATPSRTPGPAGNVEFFLRLQRPAPALGVAGDDVLAAAVAEGAEVARGA